MAFYNQISTYPAHGVPGDKAAVDQSVYTPVNYLAGDEAGIAAGGFVSASSVAGCATATIGTAILGFVERVLAYPDYDIDNEGTLVIPQNYPLTIAVKGSYYAAAPGAVAIGDKVSVDANGKLAATGTDTGWVYKTAAAAAGDIVIISNWG